MPFDGEVGDRTGLFPIAYLARAAYFNLPRDSPEWTVATRTAAEYARAVAAIAVDTAGLATERAGLRDVLAASALCDGPGFARRFTRAIESICRPGVTPVP